MGTFIKNVFICHAEKDFREVVAHWEASEALECYSLPNG